ncbi:hypothetical protein LQU94_00400 [Peptoniphilus sp. KCTC 25270]|uniref:hypothetical protein n=1 Tax=Peptoniphilus sp. KCTC 25270 TaxID=2897414 RepID=UPI001E4DAE8E|nr:hypothetical protein [Peptoniphilus sp. KCTC 25270]MCD1146575.1 hypothetical protein [Peptoniphilus sp. KCTC 25270]
MKKFIRNRWTLVIAFVIVLLLNYLSSAGIVLPYSQKEISDMYYNLYAPADFIFSIWGVIYLGVVFTIYREFGKFPNSFQEAFRKRLKGLFLGWMICNIFWNITWNLNFLSISFVCIFIYTLLLYFANEEVAKDHILYREKWMVRYPIGLHLGWLIPASFANLFTLLVKWGMNGVGTLACVLTCLAIIIVVFTVIIIAVRTKNIAVAIPSLWALIGIGVKNFGFTDFAYPELSVAISASIFFVLGIVALIIFYPRRESYN